MPFLALLALSVVGAFWVAYDARRRDMHAQRWALFTLLSAMLGLPVYLIARRRHKRVPD